MKKHNGIIWLALFVFVGNTSWAEVFYEQADEVLVETVADNSTLIPCSTPVPFTTFRYPHLNAFMDVTFVGDDNYYYVNYLNRPELKGHQPGVYRSYAGSGEIKGLSTHGDPFPTREAVMTRFMGLQTHEENFVFSGFSEGFKEKGIFASFGGSPLQVLAVEGDTAPQGGTFGWPGWGSIYKNRVLYQAALATGPGNSALYLYDHDLKKTMVLVDNTTEVPGQPGVRFGFIRNQNWLYEDDVAFRGNWRDEGQGVYLISNVSSCETAADVASRIRRIADTTMEMPASGGKRFTYLTSTPVDSGRIAFRGNHILPGTTNVFSGIYTWKDDQLRAIVDTETTIPGKTDSFSGFNKWVACDKGKVVFRGKGPNGFEGLYLFDPAQNTLFMFTDNTESIDGKRIREFQIGSNCLIGNRVVFMVHFEDDSMGIYLAALPKVVARIKDSTFDPIVTDPLAE